MNRLLPPLTAEVAEAPARVEFVRQAGPERLGTQNAPSFL